MHQRLVTGVAAVVTAILALVVQSGPAGAASPDPVVSSRSVAGSDARFGAWWTLKAGGLSEVPTRPLVPPDLQVTARHAVSQDGNVLAVAAGTVAPTHDPFDESRGLLLVVRNPTTSAVTARVLSSRIQANPVVSADGSTVWWMADGALWRYAGGVTSLVTATRRWPRTYSSHRLSL